MSEFLNRLLSLLAHLLPSDLRRVLFGAPREQFEVRFNGDEERRFGKTVRDIAAQQGRAESEVYYQILEEGVRHVVRREIVEYKKKWDSLSTREKEVAALTHLDRRSYEIAEILGLSYDTVRSHSKKIYKKFGLSNKDSHQARNELRALLNDFNRDFDLREWWGLNHA